MFISDLQNWGHGKSVCKKGYHDETSQFVSWGNSVASADDLNRRVKCLVVLRFC